MAPQALGRAGLIASALGTLLLSAACGESGEDTGPSDAPVTIEKAPETSGDDQEGITSLALPGPLRVLITRDGRPVGDVPVSWSAENGGAMTPSITVSNEAGIAESEWILGSAGGRQSASASVEDGVGSPVRFTARAIAPRPPLTITVEVQDDHFAPRDITILVGQTVTLAWAEGGNAHNVTPANGVAPDRSGPPVPGPHTYVYTFNAPGVYTYFCEPHGAPNGTGMAGTVTVLTAAP